MSDSAPHDEKQLPREDDQKFIATGDRGRPRERPANLRQENTTMTTTTREHLFGTEAQAQAARRDLINRGAAVSLIAYDPARDRYAFDAGAIPSTCGAWNYSHDCRLPEEHPGDHLCAGCSDVWNRGPWDDDAGEWEDDRPAYRCSADAEPQ